MNIYLAWRNAAWQGDTLLGVYSTLQAAQDRLDEGQAEDGDQIEAVTLNTPTNSWHGN